MHFGYLMIAVLKGLIYMPVETHYQELRGYAPSCIYKWRLTVHQSHEKQKYSEPIFCPYFTPVLFFVAPL